MESCSIVKQVSEEIETNINSIILIGNTTLGEVELERSSNSFQVFVSDFEPNKPDLVGCLIKDIVRSILLFYC